MIEKTIMQEILIDRRQLILECDIEKFDDFFVTLHDLAPSCQLMDGY